jgi:transposase
MKPSSLRLESVLLAGLPVINHFLDRLGLDDLFGQYVPHRDRRCLLPPATGLGLLVRNVLHGRAPLYALEEWATPVEPAQLRLAPGQAHQLNDDRVGRTLDALFDADRASLLTDVVVRAVREFEVDLDQLHNDSTTVTFAGQYATACGGRRRGRPTLRITHGHNKDHRPDLKQILWILTVSADGAVPVHFRWSPRPRSPSARGPWRAERASPTSSGRARRGRGGSCHPPRCG